MHKVIKKEFWTLVHKLYVHPVHLYIARVYRDKIPPTVHNGFKVTLQQSMKVGHRHISRKRLREETIHKTSTERCFLRLQSWGQDNPPNSAKGNRPNWHLTGCDRFNCGVPILESWVSGIPSGHSATMAVWTWTSLPRWSEYNER